MTAQTLYDKLWNSHVVRQEADGTALLYIDRHLVHEVTSPQAFEGLKLAGRPLWRVDSVVSTADHNTPTDHWDEGIKDPISRQQVETLDANIRPSARWRISRSGQGPGHRACDGAGAGRHAAGHDGGVRRQPHLHPRRFRRVGARHRHLRGGACDGHPVPGGQEIQEYAGAGGRPIGPRHHRQDVALAIIGKIGTAGGTGYAIEFAGAAIESLSMEGRMSLCNMAIEAARSGMVAVDQKTIDYVKAGRSRPRASSGSERWRIGAVCIPIRAPYSTRKWCCAPRTSCRR